MRNLILNDVTVAIPIVFFALAVGMIIVIAALSAKKRSDSQQSAANYKMVSSERQNAGRSTGGTGIARPYTSSITMGDSSHSHPGDDAEHYEKIVGSLGEVDDEGCADLDGIRLIAHDAAYEGDEESRNYAEIVKAMVLGEILDNPRFKSRHR